MLLEGGESLLRSAYAVLEPSAQVTPQRGPGVLYLTNRRIVFETPASRGAVRDFVGGKDTHLAIDVPLKELRNLTIRRGRVGRARLVLDLVPGRVAFDVLEPDAWAAEISQAKRDTPSAPLPAQTHTVEREIVKIRCRFCGALGNEVHGRCPSCGAPL